MTDQSKTPFLYYERNSHSFEKAIHLVWTPKKLGLGSTNLEIYLTQGLELDLTRRQLMLNINPENPIVSMYNLSKPPAELVYDSRRGIEPSEVIKDGESVQICWALERRDCQVLSYTQVDEGYRLIHASPEIRKQLDPFLVKK
jgi:hypothetical protein